MRIVERCRRSRAGLGGAILIALAFGLGSSARGLGNRGAEAAEVRGPLGPQALSITPVADTWYEIDVGTGAPVNATPQGASPRLSAGWSDVGIDERAVMRFAVPTSAPETALLRAELELDLAAADVFVFGPPPQALSGTMRIALREVEASWDEASLTSLSPPATGDVSESTELRWGPCTDAGCGRLRLDLTERFTRRQLRPPGEDWGLTIEARGLSERSSFGTVFELASRESDRPPLLHLTWRNVPLDETPTATPTASPSPTRSPEPSATPSPSATPGPPPTWEARDFEGLFGASFEVLSFVEGGQGCPGYGAGYWLEPNRAFSERYAALQAGRSPYQPPLQTDGYIVQARFRGRLSPPGAYGHLGAYARAIQVLELHAMEDVDRCGMELPDLTLASHRYGWTEAPGGGCTPGRPGDPTIELCIVNQGRQPAGDAWVELRYQQAVVARRRICGLQPGETRCLAPAPMPVSVVRVDVDDEVPERFEANNWLNLSVPTFTPPPTCTALPPGRPSPTPRPTATYQACITPPPSPTPSLTPTRGPHRIHLPLGVQRRSEP